MARLLAVMFFVTLGAACNDRGDVVGPPDKQVDVEMKIQIWDSFDSLSIDDVAQLERRLGVRLPVEYKKFLLEYNGGFFADDIVYIDPKSGDVTYIDSFFAVKPLNDTFDLERYRTKRLEHDSLPAYLIPIASGHAGATCISVRDVDFGTLYYWYLGIDPEEESDALDYVAKDLPTFLRGLQVNPESSVSEETIPLLRDAEMGNIENLKRHIVQGVDLNVQNAQGITALEIACDRPDVAQLLLEAGANPNFLGRHGDTPAHDAKSSTVLRLLLEHGADPNVQNNSGKTALMIRVAHLDARSVAILLEHSADPTLKDKDGKRAIDYCKPWTSPRIVSLLKDAEKQE